MTFEQETKEISNFLRENSFIFPSGILTNAAERLDAQAAQIEQQAKQIESLRLALTEITEWTDRYTSPGHPVSTVAKRALTGQ